LASQRRAGDSNHLFTPFSQLLTLFLLLFHGDDVVFDPFGIPTGSDDLERILLQGLDPGTDVRQMLAWIVADAQVLAEHPGGDFRSKLLPGIDFGAERAELPGQARGMAGPVAELVQGRGVVSVLPHEVVFGWQADLVRAQAVEGPVALVVLDDRAGVLKDGLGFFVRVPGRHQNRFVQRRNLAGKLAHVEDRGEAHDGPGQLDLLHDLVALIVQHRLSVVIPGRLFPGELPVDDALGFLPLLHPTIQGVGLAKRHPARVVEAVAREHHPVDTAVDRAGNRIHRRKHLAGLPGLLPGGHAALQVLDDLLRKLLMKGFTVFLVSGHGQPPPRPRPDRPGHRGQRPFLQKRP